MKLTSSKNDVPETNNQRETKEWTQETTNESRGTIGAKMVYKKAKHITNDITNEWLTEETMKWMWKGNMRTSLNSKNGKLGKDWKRLEERQTNL